VTLSGFETRCGGFLRCGRVGGTLPGASGTLVQEELALSRVPSRGSDTAVVVDVCGAVVVSGEVVVVSVLVVSVLVVLVVSVLVVLVVSVVAVVSVLVVGSVVVGGESARAAAAAPLPKRTNVASVAISFLRAMGRDYRR
jgi:hypothetical protein